MVNKLKTVLAGVIAVLSPLREVLIVVSALVLVNLLVGFLAQLKRKLPLLIHKNVKEAAIRLIFYIISGILAYYVELYLTGPELPMLKIATTLIGIAETRRFLDNVSVITDNPVFSSISRAVSPPAKDESGGPGESK